MTSDWLIKLNRAVASDDALIGKGKVPRMDDTMRQPSLGLRVKSVSSYGGHMSGILPNITRELISKETLEF